MQTVLVPVKNHPSNLHLVHYSQSNGFGTYNGVKSLALVKQTAHYVHRDKDRYTFLKVNGYLPQYPYSCKYYEWGPVVTGNSKVTHTNGVWRRGVGLYNVTDLGAPPVTGAAITALSSNLHNQITAQVNSNVKNLYYSTFETLFEGRKTKKMVADAAMTIAGALRDVKNGRFTRAARRLGLKSTPKKVRKSRSLSANWLEYRYGWGPVYFTVYGEMVRQYDRMKTQEPVQRVSIWRKGTTTLADTVLSGYYRGESNVSLLVNWSIRSKVTQKVSCKQVAYYRVHNKTLADSSSIGLTNPVLVAYELVPLSFVLDWFVNISDLLEAFDAWAGKTYLTGTKTTFIEATRTTVSESPNVGTGYSLDWNPASAVVYAKSLDREILGSPPSVSLNFSVGLNNTRLVDGIALLRQLVFKR